MLNQTLDYLRHLLRCKSKYSLHSPFVYNWHQEVLRKENSSEGKAIETLRRKLKQDKRIIRLKDFGAGSRDKGATDKTQILGQLVAKASRKRASGELLYRLCKEYQPKRCLEFGTHIGISSLYQVKALADSQFITMEGDPGLAAIASENFQKFEVRPVQLIGEFSKLLEKEIELGKYNPDYVFIDGNHKYAPTLKYFQQLLPHMPDESIIVFDDIYWSGEMKKTWAEIISHPDITISIDLYFMGICFIRRKQAKEHFCFRL